MPVSVTCPNCGHLWPWNASTAGRQARCRCGALMTFPAAAAVVPVDEPVEPSVDDPWSQPFADVGTEPEPPTTDGIPLPTPLTVVPPAAKPRKERLTRTLPYRAAASFAGKAPTPFDRRTGLLIGSPARDFWVPLGLVVVGVLLYFGRTIFLQYHFSSSASPFGAQKFLTALAGGCVQLLVNGIITMAVVVAFGKLMDMDYGTTAGTALKLAALSVFPQAVSGVAFLMVGTCMGLFVVCLCDIGIMLPMFSLLFDIGVSEAVLCVMTVTVLEVFSWAYVANFVDGLF